jgi:hypothetical protein
MLGQRQHTCSPRRTGPTSSAPDSELIKAVYVAFERRQGPEVDAPISGVVRDCGAV